MSRPHLEISETRREHATAVRQLHAAVRLQTYPNEAEGVAYDWVVDETNAWLTPERMAEFESKLDKIIESPNQLHLVAHLDDRLIGFAHGSKDEGRQEIRTLYVDSEFHGQGVARDLIKRLFSWFDMGEDIVLEVVPYNVHARAVYRHYGFREMPGTERVYEKTIPFVGMKRTGERQ